MKAKDLTILAIDKIAEALQALIRIDYDNLRQCVNNQVVAANLLKEAVELLLTDEDE